MKAKNNTKILIILFSLATLFCFLTMFYNDMAITSQYGVVWIDSIFDRRPLSFYANCVAANVTPEGAVYDIGIYILFGIWSIPVWIAHTFAGVSVLSPLCIIWYKILVGVFLAGDAYLVYRISNRCGLSKEKALSAATLFIIVPFTFFPVFVAVQYDVIILFFMLLGITAYIEDKYVLFLFFFALSLTMKPFTIFVFVVLVLMRHRNILKILRDGLLGASLMFLCKGIYSLGPKSFEETNGAFLLGKFRRLFTMQITEEYIVPLFVVSMCALYLYLWIKKDFGSGIEFNRKALFYSGCSMGMFCVLADIFPYWTVYFGPFLVIFLFWIDKKFIYILDIISEVALLLVFIYKYYWVYGGSNTYASLYLKYAWDAFDMATKNTTVGGGLGRFGLGYVIIPLFLVYAVGEMIILICASRFTSFDENSHYDKVSTNEELSYVLYVILIYGFIALTLISLVASR